MNGNLMSDLRKVIIDETELEVEGSMTLIQALSLIHISEPTRPY